MTTKDGCLICQIISGKIPSFKIYEDDSTLAVLDVNGASPGHCFVMPKNHYPILEQVPDDELAHMFSISNKISGAIFEGLKVQGTNIFARNGIPAGQTVAHFMLNVIPRDENDGINLQWKSKQLSEEEMSTVELKLKEQIKNTGVAKVASKPKTIEEAKPEVMDDNDYLAQHLRRLP